MPPEKPKPPDLRAQIGALGKPPPVPPKRVLGAELPPKAVHAQRQPTLTAMPAPPPPGAPVPVSEAPTFDATLDSGPAKKPSPSPESGGRVLVANPYDPPTLTRRARAELERHGDRLEEAPRSEVAEYRTEPRWWHTAWGMVKVIGALSIAITAVSAATTTAVVSIINALRQPTDPKLREDVEGTRKELSALRTYLADKDVARDHEQEQIHNALKSKLIELDIRYPPLKLDPLRSPK